MEQDCRHATDVTVDDLLRSAKEMAAEGRLTRALEILEQLLHDAPDQSEALRVRGTVLFQLGQTSKALADLDRAITLHPDCAACYFERGTVHLCKSNVQAAIEDFSNCLAVDPTHAPALASRAAMLLQAARLEEALEDITSAAAARPQNDRDIHNRAVVLAHLGRTQEAIREYERALVLNPDSGGTHNNLAWLLATAPDSNIRDGKRAVEHALRAVELGENGAWLDTLAAAHAECGDFEAAIRAEEAAYSRSDEGNTAFLKRMALYRRGVSYASWLEARKRDEDV